MIKPLHDYVLLEVSPSEKKVGSIILTSQKEKSNLGVVVSVGEGSYQDGKLVPITLNIGQKVLYKEYSTTEYVEGDKKYLLVKQEDIIAVIE